MGVLESSRLAKQENLGTKEVLPGIEEIVSGEEPDCDEGVSNSRDNFQSRTLTKQSTRISGGWPGGDSKVRKSYDQNNNPKDE